MSWRPYSVLLVSPNGVPLQSRNKVKIANGAPPPIQYRQAVGYRYVNGFDAYTNRADIMWWDPFHSQWATSPYESQRRAFLKFRRHTANWSLTSPWKNGSYSASDDLSGGGDVPTSSGYPGAGLNPSWQVAGQPIFTAGTPLWGTSPAPNVYFGIGYSAYMPDGVSETSMSLSFSSPDVHETLSESLSDPQDYGAKYASVHSAFFAHPFAADWADTAFACFFKDYYYGGPGPFTGSPYYLEHGYPVPMGRPGYTGPTDLDYPLQAPSGWDIGWGGITAYRSQVRWYPAPGPLPYQIINLTGSLPSANAQVNLAGISASRQWIATVRSVGAGVLRPDIHGEIRFEVPYPSGPAGYPANYGDMGIRYSYNVFWCGGRLGPLPNTSGLGNSIEACMGELAMVRTEGGGWELSPWG